MVLPVLRAFQPDLVLVCAGFDAADGDPLGGFELTPAVFGDMTRGLAGVAGGGRLVLALEGGYNVEVTAECGSECVRALLGDQPRVAPPPLAHDWARVPPEDQRLLYKIAEAHRARWPVIAAHPIAAA
mmetsp:Transcript_70852/g.189175  ORF Transcript_70852/g.189175 Transcript_70852/m.189175 type:complete len:128 (-) Transcript_70852:46-429(-)